MPSRRTQQSAEATLKASLEDAGPVHYDLQITSEDRIQIFIDWKGEMSVWEGTIKSSTGKIPWIRL